MPMKLVRWIPIAAIVLSACVRVGREFPAEPVERIEVGRTTQVDVRAFFGEPWRTGIEDGRTTWTYGRYEWRAFGEATTRDLVLRFDDDGVVASYTYNASNPE